MKNKTKKGFFGLFFALILAVELAVLADLGAVFLGHPLPRLYWGVGTGLVFLLLALLPIRRQRLKEDVLALLFVFLLGAALVGVFLFVYSRQAAFPAVDHGKDALFADHTVLVIVPHEDDELNLAAGVMDGYLQYGSEVSLLFTTNGDFCGLGERRINEALACAQALGIPAERVFFLGYGDGWEGGTHLYNAPSQEVLRSAAGYTETYGTAEHPAFRPGVSYTREHFVENLADVLRLVRPDVILANEYEGHADHRAASLFLEEALGQLLREEPGYQPLLLKGLSYSTAYNAPHDFYAENILSTQNPGDGDSLSEQPLLHWSERTRLPVADATLSRSVFSSATFWQLRRHATQGIDARAEGVINGDRVFWLRRTDSLCLRAEISASSGDAARLQDFKLLDSLDLCSDALPTAGTWVPAGEDGERSVHVTLERPAALTELCLYDNPSLKDNVLNVAVTFDNGQRIETGPLEKDGSATHIPLDGETVQSFTIQLLRTQGSQAGLTEIEAYATDADTGLDFVKIMDDDENFVYDDYLDPRGKQSFALYTSGDAVDSVYRVSSVKGDRCSAIIHAKMLEVSCPRGRSCTVTVTSADGRFSDTVSFSNPGRFLRLTGPRIDQFLFHAWRMVLPESNSFCLLRDGYRLLRYGTTASAADM